MHPGYVFNRNIALSSIRAIEANAWQILNSNTVVIPMCHLFTPLGHLYLIDITFPILL